MKIHKNLLMILILFICSCNSVSPEMITVAETTVQTETEYEFTLCTIYPDGTEYVSTDNGETWYSNGAETEKPHVYITAHSGNVYDFSTEIYVMAESETDEKLYYGKGPGLYYNKDGEYILAYDYAYLQTAYLLVDGMKTPLIAYEPDTAENLSAGQYRYIKKFSDYTCYFDFYMD